MKVLFVTRKWPPAVGGMETYSRNFTEELKRLVELEVYALPGRPDGSPPGALTLTWFFIRTAVRLLNHSRKWDLIHFGDFVLFPLAWLHWKKSPKTPRLAMVHGLDVIFGNRRGWKASLYRHFLGWARNRRHCLDKIIVNSRNTGRLVEQAGLGESVVIPLGVKLDQCAVTKALPVDRENRYLLFAGRLVPRKGAAWFATNVMPLLADDVNLKVVGKTWDTAEEQTLRSSPRTECLGYVSDAELARLRAGAVATIMPNIPSAGGDDVEGFGISALEAAVSGAPLVAADLEGISDAVIDGITGFLLEPLQPERWARKIQELLEWSIEERRTFAETARSRVKRDFSWVRVAEETVAVYQLMVLRTNAHY
jgi:glycosyltransferase involved in cell wall biosynthesis